MKNTIKLVPRGQPDAGAKWSDPNAREIELVGETASDWYGKPFAWEEAQ